MNIVRDKAGPFVFRAISEKEYNEVSLLEQGPAGCRYQAAVFVRQMMTLSPRTFLVALTGDVPVGYLVSMPLPEDPSTAWILRLRVREDMQRKGIGTTLLQHCHDILRDQEVSWIFLSCSPKNAGALSLYARSGYRITGLQPGYFGADEDRHILSLNLETGDDR